MKILALVQGRKQEFEPTADDLIEVLGYVPARALWDQQSPNNSIPVAGLPAFHASYASIDAALVPKGAGALLAAVPNSAASGGNKRGYNAVDWQMLRDDAAEVASGNYSVVGGGYRNKAAALYSTVSGGRRNTAWGVDSNVAGGQQNEATVDVSCVGGGYKNTANALGASVPGGTYGTTRGIVGYQALPACYAPVGTMQGTTQGGTLILGRETTNATPTVLASDANTPGTTNQLILPNYSAFYVQGHVVALRETWIARGWDIKCLIRRGNGANTTAIVGTPTVTAAYSDSGTTGWAVALAADTTNGGLKITVTGQSSAVIRWCARINTAEVAFNLAG